MGLILSVNNPKIYEVSTLYQSHYPMFLVFPMFPMFSVFPVFRVFPMFPMFSVFPMFPVFPVFRVFPMFPIYMYGLWSCSGCSFVVVQYIHAYYNYYAVTLYMKHLDIVCLCSSASPDFVVCFRNLNISSSFFQTLRGFIIASTTGCQDHRSKIFYRHACSKLPQNVQGMTR